MMTENPKNMLFVTQGLLNLIRMIFKEKKELLSLYNAVNNSHYEKEEDLQIVTLGNAVYMNMKNDLAFLIDFRLYLYEHQSTYNPNMPLRDLFYVASEYQKLLDSCRMLKEYMLYVDHVRKYAGQSDITLDAAVKRAVDECIKKNILADFLRKNRAEAIHMSIFEYDEERELALLRKEEYNVGREAGMEIGRKTGIRETTENIVHRMFSAGIYSLEEISHISGMDIEDVKELGN